MPNSSYESPEYLTLSDSPPLGQPVGALWTDTDAAPAILNILLSKSPDTWSTLGATGATGPTGPQGPIGNTGPTGPPGTTLHSGLSDVTANQHHAQLHVSAHATAGADALTPAAIGAVATTGAETVAGVKTFSSVPVIGIYDGSNPSLIFGNDVNNVRYGVGAFGGALKAYADGSFSFNTGAPGAFTEQMTISNAGTGTLGGQAIVKTNDARLTDSRTPTAHATSHNSGGSDVLAIDAAAATGSLRTLGTGAAQAAAGNDSRLSDARTPTTHASTHNAGGADVMAIDAVAGTGSLRTLGSTSTSAAAGNDSRLSDSRTPLSHVINGALHSFPGGTTTYLRADGTFSTVTATAPDIALSLIAPAVDETITAGYSAVVNRSYAIASGKKLTIGLGARFRIL